MANSVDPDQTAPIGTDCSGSTLCASILNSSVILGNYLQQTSSAEDFSDAFFLGALRVYKGKGKHSSTKSPAMAFDRSVSLKFYMENIHLLC